VKDLGAANSFEASKDATANSSMGEKNKKRVKKSSIVGGSGVVGGAAMFGALTSGGVGAKFQMLSEGYPMAPWEISQLDRHMLSYCVSLETTPSAVRQRSDALGIGERSAALPPTPVLRLHAAVPRGGGSTRACFSVSSLLGTISSA